MRFHTTFKDIVVATIVLLSCTAAVWWGMANLGLPNPSEVLATNLIERLDRDGDFSVHIGSVGRDYLRTLHLHHVEISYKDQKIGSIGELIIPGGLGRVIAAAVSHSYTLRIEATDFDLQIDQMLFDWLIGEDSNSTSATSSAPLERLGLVLDLQKATIEANLDIGSFSLFDGNVVVDLRGGLADLLIAGDARRLTADTKDLLADINDLRFGLDEEGRSVIEAKRTSGSAYGAHASFEELVGILDRDGQLSLSLANLFSRYQGLEAASEQVSFHAKLQHQRLEDITLAVSSFTVEQQSWSLSGPSMTVVGSAFDRGVHSLVLASREGGLFDLQTDGFGTYQGADLSARFSVNDRDELSGSFTFAHLNASERYSVEGLTVSLFSTDTQLVDLYGTLGATARVSDWPHRGDWIEGPVQTEASWQREEDALTASLFIADAHSNLLGAPLDVYLSLQGKHENAQLETLLFLENQLEVRSVLNIEQNLQDLTVSGRLTDLGAQTFFPLIDRWAPFLKPYTQERTTFSGNISFSGALQENVPSGRLSAELALINAQIGSRNLDAGFTVLGTLDTDTIEVSSLSLAAGGYRLSFGGKALIGHWIPSGNFSLSRIDDGELLATAQISSLNPAGYQFSIEGLTDPPFGIAGSMRSQGRSSITGQAALRYLDATTAFDYSLALDTLRFTATQTDILDLEISLLSPQSLFLEANRFPIPATGIHYSGRLTGLYHDLSQWSLRGEEMLIEQLPIAGRPYDLQFSIDASSRDITIPVITIIDDDEPFRGSLFYRGTALSDLVRRSFIAPFDFGFTLADTIRLTVQGEQDRLGIFLDINGLPLGRFGQFTETGRVDLSLVGETNFADIVDIDALVRYEDANTRFSTALNAQGNRLDLFDISFSRGELTYSGSLFTLEDNHLEIAGAFDHLRHLSYLSQPSHASISLSLSFDRMQNLFDLPQAIRGAIEEGQRATVRIEDNLLLLAEGGIRGGEYDIHWDGQRLAVASELLSLSYETDSQHFTLQADPRWGIGVNAWGSLGKDDFGVVAKDIHLPLPLLNRTFLKPVFAFHTGIAEGEVFLGGSREAIRPYGQLFINSTEMYVFWLPDDLIHMKGASVTIDGDRATTGEIPFFSTNVRTGRTVQGYGNLAAHLDGLSLLNYEIHAYRFDHPVYVWVPMAGFDADISGYAHGTFNLFGIGFETWLDGDLVISDMVITLGIRDLPYWYEPAYMTTTSFNVTTAKGVNFVYPNTPTPIIRATFTENQHFSFSYDHLADQFEIDGNFAFRSGELYYFQKNFLITEGQMVLHTDALSGRNTITPRINLRARISDFDALGNRVDIFLVLRDSTLTNLNPIFESTPAKEVNEIMEILGQSILPTGAYGEIGLYSVASLAAAATDVAERLGYLEISQTTQLTETMRISLGLDLFSIRSNIVQNILFDALPVTGIMGSLSPIARYLHNTSIFLGKYIGSDFFLQALIHLSAMERSKVNTSFLSPDLSFDLELSLDWENPLSTISFFTQPRELSFTNILDTMGFSVTKRIVLR